MSERLSRAEDSTKAADGALRTVGPVMFALVCLIYLVTKYLFSAMAVFCICTCFVDFELEHLFFGLKIAHRQHLKFRRGVELSLRTGGAWPKGVSTVGAVIKMSPGCRKKNCFKLELAKRVQRHWSRAQACSCILSL